MIPYSRGMFHSRLRERFGEKSSSFSEHLTETLFEFWQDGTCVGEAWPENYEHDGTNRKLKILSHFGPRCSELSDNVRELLVGFWRDAVAYGKGRMCLHCGTQEGVQMEAARTAYELLEGELDPNADVPLCGSCAAEHHEHWDEMWAEYHAGCM